MQRINVIGTSGSGKSHFSRELAQQLDMPYVQLDAMYWLPQWQEPETAVFADKVRPVLLTEKWVLDGNFSKINAIKWQRVDTIIWLDYGFFRTLYQVFMRSLRRAWQHQEIWPGTGNKESFRRSFLSSESVILWMLKNYRNNRRKYTRLFNDEGMQGIRLVRLTSPKAARRFLKGLK